MIGDLFILLHALFGLPIYACAWIFGFLWSIPLFCVEMAKEGFSAGEAEALQIAAESLQDEDTIS